MVRVIIIFVREKPLLCRERLNRQSELGLYIVIAVERKLGQMARGFLLEEADFAYLVGAG